MHDVINPATEQVIASVPSLSVEQTDEAIARAHATLPAWTAVTPEIEQTSCAGSPMLFAITWRSWHNSK